jgi:hypothetical protein
MLRLENAELVIDLLDPIADRDRLGTRFCAGGFIWQVHDRSFGPLLTGPEWPNPSPSPLNAQGLPESFRHSTTAGQPLLWRDNIGLAPGAGELRRGESGGALLTHPCNWTVARTAEQVTFTTEQTVLDWNYALERRVRIERRKLTSVSRLSNHGRSPLVLEWFVHPFFALTEGRARVLLPAATTMHDNSGYELSDGGLSFRRAFIGENDGHLDHLILPSGKPFRAEISHPILAYVRFETGFVPFKCVVWANGNTLSLEPFLALALAPGEVREWNVEYEFGPAK